MKKLFRRLDKHLSLSSLVRCSMSLNFSLIRVVNPRIIFLDCSLEYKKGENQTNAELVQEEDWGVCLNCLWARETDATWKVL